MSSASLRMSAAQRWRALSNSPTWLRDGVTVTSPWRMSVWFLMLNALILVSVVWVYMKVSIPDQYYSYRQTAIANMGLGRLFAGTIFLALSFFLTILVPFRVAGVLFAPRVGRYFDQIVLSGITPWRFMVGKVIGQQVFFLIVITVSLPYFLLCLGFGSVSFGEVLLCVGMLFIYVQVLVVAYLVASTLLSEVLALPLVVGLFLLAAVFGLERLSPNPISSLTPTGTILGMFFEDTAQRFTYTFRGGFGSLGLGASHALLFAILSGCILSLGGLAVALGPINVLASGLNTFGAVVLKGDKKRSSFLKKRYDLRRLSELSFLYENNSAPWRARDFARRWMLRELVVLLLMASALIWTYWLFPPFGGEMYAVLQFFCVGALLTNTVSFADPWMAERLYTKRWEAGTLNTLCFLGNSLLIWLGFAWLPSFFELDTDPRAVLSHYKSMEIQEINLILVSHWFLMGLAFYAMYRWALVKRFSKNTGLVVAAFLLVAGMFIPVWLEMLANLNLPEDEPGRMYWLSMGNPANLYDEMTGGRLSWEDARMGLWWSGSYYLALSFLFALLVWKERQRFPRRRL